MCVDNSQLLKHSKTWDRTGVFVASLCLIHCLATPFVAMTLPSISSFFENIWLEATILILGVTIGSASFYTSFRKHHQWGPMIIGTLGVLLMLGNLVHMATAGDHHHEEEMYHLFGTPIEPLIILGGFLLIVGHLWNIRECHCFCEHDCAHESHSH